ncbi:MAG: PH domain-containing protein [Gordonia sp. (in: high G+C Gram-positive bacteria)]
MPSPADPIELPQTFRIQRVVYFAVPAAALVALILAGTSLIWLGWTLILPVLLTAWIVRIRTVVTSDGITAVQTWHTREISWPELAGLQFPRWGSVRAVLVDDTKVRLPALTFQDLPRFSAASGGRIPDPYAAAAGVDS